VATDIADTPIEFGGRDAFLQIQGTGPRVRGDDVAVDVTLNFQAQQSFPSPATAELYRVGKFGEREIVRTAVLDPRESVSQTVIFPGDVLRDEYTVELLSVATNRPREPVPASAVSVSLPSSELPADADAGLPDGAITDLFLDFPEGPLAVGQSAALELTGRTAGGEVGVSVPDARFEAADPDVVTVDEFGVVTGISKGVGDIVASVQNPRQRIADDVRVTVESDARIDQPTQPPEPDEFILPFSVINAIPGIKSGAEDVPITIPQIGDIEQSLSRIVPSIEDIADIVSGEIRSLDIPDPLDTSAIEASVSRVLGDFDVPSLSQVTQTIDAELRQLDIPEPPSVDEILDPIDDALVNVQQDLETAIDELLTDIDQSIASVDRFIQDSIDSLQTTVDSVSEDIDALTEDIDTGLTDVQSTVNSIDETVPSLGDIVADVTESVIDEIEAQIIPEAEGVLLTDDVPQFLTITVEDFLAQTLSTETKQRLQERG
jgi:archaellum component FlaC